MIYELEDDDQNIKNIMQPYEDKHSIFCIVKDREGTILYQSNLDFPTDTETLLKNFNHQINMQETSVIDNSSVSEQNGIVEITGTSKEKYWGISAKVISKNDTVCHVLFLYKQKPIIHILQKQLPVYLVLWVLTLVSVIIISRFLLKKAFKPTEQILKS